jgi:hypothetical protein
MNPPPDDGATDPLIQLALDYQERLSITLNAIAAFLRPYIDKCYAALEQLGEDLSEALQEAPTEPATLLEDDYEWVPLDGQPLTYPDGD